MSRGNPTGNVGAEAFLLAFNSQRLFLPALGTLSPSSPSAFIASDGCFYSLFSLRKDASVLFLRLCVFALSEQVRLNHTPTKLESWPWEVLPFHDFQIFLVLAKKTTKKCRKAYYITAERVSEEKNEFNLLVI